MSDRTQISDDPLTMSDDGCEHEWPYWTGDPCPYCEIEQLRAENDKLRSEIVGDDIIPRSAAPTEEPTNG